jgi:hypothetical protein
MIYEPVIHGASVVMLGNFNPAIFSPAWLKLNDLIPDFDPESATVRIITGEYTDISASNMKIVVQQDRFQVETFDDPFVTILDLSIGTFGTRLTHTPIRQLGINYTVHFCLETAEQRVRFGRLLAPLGPWGGWGKNIDEESTELADTGGLREIIMEEDAPPGRTTGGYRRVHLAPSVRQDILDPLLGVFVAVNDHYVLAQKQDDPIDALPAIELLKQRFEQSIDEAKWIVSELMKTAKSVTE